MSQENGNGGRVSPSRRTVLKTIGGGSVALGSASLATISAAANGSKEIVTIRGKQDKPLKTKEVPAQWYDHLENARHARDRIGRKFENRKWFRGVGIEATDRWEDGKRGFRVSIEAENPRKARKETPEQENNAEVAVDEYHEPQPMSHCPSGAQNDQTYSCVPGGAYIEDDESWYSGGCQIQYNGSPMYLTCAHGPATNWTLGDCSTEDITGVEVDQGAARVPFGTVHEYDYNQDIAVIDAYDDNLDDTLVPEDETIFGYVSEDGIADYQSSGKTIYNYGARSDIKREGTIKKDFQWSPCYQTNFEQKVSYIRYDDIVPCNGDSGGPYYVIEDILGIGTVISMVSILYGGAEDWNTSRGPSAYDITNRYPIDFSQQSDLCS